MLPRLQASYEMLNYDYSCTECDIVFEETVDYEHRNDVKCVVCEGPAKIAWFKFGKPAIFQEAEYHLKPGNHKGTHCSSKRQLLDEIKRVNDNNPNPVELASEYYG